MKKDYYMTNDKLKQAIADYIDKHEQEMLEDLVGLIRINSEKSEPEEGKPYGAGPYEALMAAGKLCENYGFAVKTYDNRVISADMTDHAPQLDILAHMDVVPGGTGWTIGAAYEPVIQDRAVYGRGSSDDKGPAIAALYAMRAVKELGLPLSRNCRLILGSDEECGSSDIEYYYNVEQEAPMTFSPDAEFPVINVEKGRLAGTLRWINTAKSKLSETEAGVRLISCSSGHTLNIVPDKAEAILAGTSEAELSEVLRAVQAETGAAFTYDIKNLEPTDNTVNASDRYKDAELLKLNITGAGAHASTPDKGVNALTLMLSVLARLQYADKNLGVALTRLAALFPYGDHDGERIAAACEDDIAGKTTVSPDIFTADEQKLILKFDARTCIKAEEPDTDIIASIGIRAKQEGFEFEHSFVHAHAVDGSSDFVRTLLGCYEAVTGKKGACMAVGGGTYVHELRNGVAFGAVGETTDTHMHGNDEFMLISELKDAAIIYALAIAKLCG